MLAILLSASLGSSSCGGGIANEQPAAPAASPLAVLLDQIESEPPDVGVRLLEEALSSNAPQPSNSEGDLLLSRAAGYLDTARAGAATDPSLAVGLVKGYQRLGELYGPVSPPRALAFYFTAAQIVVEAAGGAPTQGAFAAQYSLLAQRIQALGGTVPGAPAEPLQPLAQATAAGTAAGQGIAAPTTPTQPPPERQLSQQELISTKDRLITVKAKCMSAEDAYRQIEQSTRRAGYAPNAAITTAYRRMQLALETAENELEAKKITEARESLNLADASANQVLEAAGAR